MLDSEHIVVKQKVDGLLPIAELDVFVASDDKVKQAKGHHGLAIHALESGNYSKAYEHSIKSTDLDPQWNYLTVLAQLSLIITFEANKMKKQAIEAAKDASLLAPDQLKVWIVYGNIALATYNFDQAIAAYSRAHELVEKGTIDEAKILTGLGHAFDKTNDKRMAIDYYKRSIAINPDDKHTCYLLATRFIDDTHDPNGLSEYSERAIGGPDGDLAEWNAALGNLAIGNWKKGWAFHEIRKKIPEFNGKITSQGRFPNKPEWTGQTHVVDGITQEMRPVRVHVVREQGMGDALQFVRYLHLMTQMGCRVQMECNTPMGQLLEHSFPGIDFIPMLNDPTNVPDFDYHCLLMSLPHILKMPVYWGSPYIKAEPAYIAKWYEKLSKYTLKPRIGVCWAGERRSHDARCHQLDSQRSLSFEQIEPVLIANRHIDFISLQMGNPVQRSHGSRYLFRTDHEIEHWSDTAGIIANLDAVISVDTSLLHAAGAMGKKTWMLDRYAPCWRWPNKLDKDGRNDWYPSVKIIRQSRYKDWSDVLEKLNHELRDFKP